MRITEHILEPSFPPSPLPSFFICLNKDYYKNKMYRVYNNVNSILGVVSDDVLDYLNNSDIEFKIKIKILLFLSMLRVKERNGGGHDGWLGMKTVLIESLLGSRDWAIVKKICLEQKFIEVNESYRAEFYCRQYRLNRNNKKYKTIRYFAKGKSFNSLLKKIKELPRKNAPNLENQFENKVANYFTKTLERISLAPDYEQIIDSLNKPEKEEIYHQSCDRVLNKEYNIAVNPENGRWTNSITNFPKILRNQLLYDGQKMMELDFANMQPWMVIQLYPHDCSEKEKYLKLVQSAEFYDFFAQKTNHDISTPKKKKSFKKRILREIYFGGLEKIQFYRNWDVFCEIFPILAKIILNFREKGNKKFAKLLQRKESLIMIDGALNEIIDRGIPCLTIHDSVLCLRKDYSAVLSIMEKHFMRQIPHKPTIKFNLDN